MRKFDENTYIRLRNIQHEIQQLDVKKCPIQIKKYIQILESEIKDYFIVQAYLKK